MAQYLDLKKLSEEEELIELCKHDLIAFGKLFLPDDFMRSETPPFHYQIADTFLDKTQKQVALILPRGHGKTILTKANILHDFCFADPTDVHFYAWVSATHKLSVGNMDYIKYHLEFNDLIRRYFGNLRDPRLKWTEEDIELKNGCKLISRSNVAGIRGGAKLHRRYDLVILDDFEHEANTITEDSRDKNANLVTAVVYPALEPITGRLRVNGTPVHYDSFINRLLQKHLRAKEQNKLDTFSWNVIFHKAISDQDVVLWPSFFTRERLAERKKFFADSDQPQKYYQEYMMEVISEQDKLWSRKHIVHHNYDYEWSDRENHGFIFDLKNKIRVPVNCFIGCDPATDIDTKDSDFSVIMVVAIDPSNNLYCLEYERHRSIPTIGLRDKDGEIDGKTGVVDYIFELYDKYHCEHATVEDVAMNRSVFQSINGERQRLDRWDIAVVEGKPGGMNKRNRIYSALSGRFSQGKILIRENMYELIKEVVTFGRKMGKDDTIESVYYADHNSYPPGIVEEPGRKELAYTPPETTKQRSWTVL